MGSRARARTPGRSVAVAALVWLTTLGHPGSAQPPDAPAGMHCVDGVAALVGGRAPAPDVDVVLLSDVDLRARLALSGQGGEQLPLGPLPDALLAATLDQVLGEVLIAREAERVRVAAPSPREVARERERLVVTAGGEARLRALLDALSVPPREIDQIAQRRALVASFLEANLEGTTTVTEAEVARLYEAKRAAGAQDMEGVAPEVARARLRHALARQALNKAIARWVDVLRSRTPLRLLAPYAEPTS